MSSLQKKAWCTYQLPCIGSGQARLVKWDKDGKGQLSAAGPVECRVAETPGSLHCGAGLAGSDVGLEVAFFSGSGGPGLK